VTFVGKKEKNTGTYGEIPFHASVLRE